MNSQNIGLIVEGGGMRGAYTAGVLDAFSDHHLSFPYMIGVSAGANVLCSYLSQQKGRNKRLFTEWIADKRFINISNLWKEGSYFGMDFLFDELPTTLDPFDFNTFIHSNVTFKVGLTHCQTGRAMFVSPLQCETADEAHLILRASSSLPGIAKPVLIRGQYFLDGGISDSIPIKKSIADGHTYNVLILTRNASYRKKYSKASVLLAKRSLKKYPRLIDAISKRYKVYNETVDFINAEEANGNAFIIRPQASLVVDRFEKNPDKLKALYEQGYNEATAQIDSLQNWLKEKEGATGN